ncbi:MAG: AMP-dependent synthetase, partial [Pararhizobium sp.]
PVLALLLFLPRVPVPGWLKTLILPISAAGFHIYLMHRFVPELLLLPVSGRFAAPVFSGLAIVGGISLGVAAWSAQKQALSLLAKHGDIRIGLAAVRRQWLASLSADRRRAPRPSR